MKLDYLIDCSVNFIKIIIKQYELNKVDISFFNENTELKIQFLKDNFRNIKSLERKRKVQKILDAYSKIDVIH